MTRIMTRISEKNRTALLLLGLCLLLGTGRALGLSEADIQDGGGGQEQRDDPRNTSSHTNHTLCRQQMKIGLCRAAFPRFYYDVTNQSCRSFTWGGCGANGNNFKTREECEDTCRGVTGSVLPDESLPAKDPRMRVDFSKKVSQDVQSEPAAKESAPALEKGMSAADFAERCGAEPLTGPCRASFQNWYYNSKTGGCQSFIYGGCGGNKNNYDSQESCIANCTVQVLPSSRKVAAADDDDEVDSMREYEAHCLVPADGGFCRGFFPMFYYDAPTATCRSFTYGGCRGNKNRYDTVEECVKRCSGGAFDTRGKRRDRWTPAVFLFVTLAAVSALLLASLVIIPLRRHRLTRRPSSISDKEELLPDPDEPSVETLTIPESPKPDQA